MIVDDFACAKSVPSDWRKLSSEQSQCRTVLGQVHFVDTRARSVVACDEQIAIYRAVLFKVLNRAWVTGPGPNGTVAILNIITVQSLRKVHDNE
jgi:hypothetical protein